MINNELELELSELSHVFIQDIKTQRFLVNVKEALGDGYYNYDFSNSIFKGLTKPITYICLIHNVTITKEARHILKGRCCRKCGTDRRNSRMIEESKRDFFTRAPLLHNNFYSYDKVVFKGTRVHVIITCPEHGDFLQKPVKHLGNMERGFNPQGCNHCGNKRAHEKTKMGKEEFIRKSKEKHGSYRYNYDAVIYFNCNKAVEIFCNIHNKMFQQTPTNHLCGHGCLECGIEKRAAEKVSKASEKFWQIAIDDERYDWSKFVYTKAVATGTLICRKCNNDFTISPNNYLRGKGCPCCKKKTELKFYTQLVQLYPEIIWNFQVDWCRNPKDCNGKHNYFPYDFCIANLKIIIELDGVQHLRSEKFFDRKLSYDERHERDIYKEKCANDNGYHTIRILQEDVLYEKNAWIENVQREIEYIGNNQEDIHHRYICDNHEYDMFL
jgi:hypothetical protein